MEPLPQLECIGLLSNYFSGNIFSSESQRRESGDSSCLSVDQTLRYSQEPLQRSILRIASPYEKEALEMFKLILHWMSLPNGQSLSEKKTDTVADILAKANVLVGMENEVYLQLLKQTRANWKHGHEKNAWKLFGIIAKELTCTSGVYPCVFRYVLSSASRQGKDPLVRCLAFDVLKTMKESQQENASMAFGVSIDRHPLDGVEFCHVLLPDGTTQEVAFDADTTVSDTVIQVCWKIGCERPENFALIADFGTQRELLEIDGRLANLLKSSEFRRNGNETKLHMRRVIFRWTDHSICDEDFINLLYAQAKGDYLNGDYAVSEQQMAYLSALQIFAEHDPSIADDDVTLPAIVRKCTPDARLAERGVSQRAVNVVAALHEHRGIKSMEAKRRFLVFFEDFSFDNAMACPVQFIGDRPSELITYTECYFAADRERIYFFWPSRDSHLLSYDLSPDISCERRGSVVHLNIASVNHSRERTIKMKTSGATVLCRMINRYRNDLIKRTDSGAARSGSVLGTSPHSDARYRTRNSTSSPKMMEASFQVITSSEIQSQQQGSEETVDSPRTVISDSDAEISLPWNDVDEASDQEDQEDLEMLIQSKSPAVPTECTKLSVGMFLRSFCSRKEKPRKKKSPLKAMDSKLDVLSKLTHGKTFARRYVITGERICEKSHIVCGITKTTNERVVLKFYTSRRTFENARKMHERCSHSKRVCKLLDVIDEEGGFPPCLVFERGTHTLDQFVEKIKPIFFQRKSILLEILMAIKEIHSHGIVHCDIKPSNIMISENHEWKILDFDDAVMQSKPAKIKATPLYCAPEILKAGWKGVKQIETETSADMWSFGVIAYELLADRRFYGSHASMETVAECIRGTDALPDISAIETPQGQSLVHKLLRPNPKDRLSAEQATDQAIFKSGDTSSLIAARFGEVTRALNMLLTLDRLDLSQAINAHLLFSVTVESFKQLEGCESPFNEAPGREVTTACMEGWEDEPFFVMRVGRNHRIRICLAHEPNWSVPVEKIVSIKVMDNTETPVDLVTKQQQQLADDGKRDAVAYLDPKIVNLQNLLRETPPLGEMSEKCVLLHLVIVVKMFGDDRLQELNHKIHCKIIAPENKVNVERFIRKFQKGWEKTPQWMQDVAKGSVLFASIGVRTY